MIAIVLYINIGLDDKSITKARDWTKKIVASILKYQGTYYLTYQRFPALDQFQNAYPKWQKFKRIKCKYDPNLVFFNKFYSEYFHTASNLKQLNKASNIETDCL